MKEPEFDKTTGYLKVGIYPMTIDELLVHPILGKASKDKL